MTSKLGCHWQRVHPDRQDMPHIEAMQYKSVKLFKDSWDNADFCRDLLTVLPKDSYILARDHALSEQKEDMWRDAVAAGIDHANQWINKVHSGEYHLPLDRTFFLGINEPDATEGDRNKIDLYTEAFLTHLQASGLRGGAFNFSTGHPRTVDGTPNTPADYSVFERSHRAIVEGHHIGVLHIYGTGAVPCAPGHYDRLKACTWTDVEWVVGELAVDEHVIGGGEHFGFHKYFDGRLNDYCGWLDTLILGINDSRIHSYQVFTYDFAHPWSEFDTHPIRPALESYQWQHMIHAPTFPATTPPVTTHLPTISTGKPTTCYVKVAKGANVRSTPALAKDNIVGAVPYGEPVTVLGYTDDEMWAQVTYEGILDESDISGWMSSPLLSPVPMPAPEPTPPPAPLPPPTGDDWSRVWPITLNIEGGLSTDRNDRGNYRPNGEFVGTKYGISANAHPDVDIVNLTKEQALEIYRRDYWLGSGADKLPWPLNLLHFDAYVQNEAAAKKFLSASGGDPDLYMAERIDWYTHISDPDWTNFSRGWMRRCATMLREASK